MSTIGSPVGAMAALRSLWTASNKAAASREKLATGLRINRGKEDPAGLITSERLRGALAALEAESRMLQRADHVAATADGALGQISDLLVEANALVVASANSAGMSPEEQQANQMQLDSIMASVNRIAGSTTFNGQRLLDGSMTLSANGQNLAIGSVHAHALGVGSINLASDDLEAAQATLDSARQQVSAMRGSLGAFQKNTIGTRLNSIDTGYRNIAAAESIIRDTDYAAETARHSRLRLLEFAAVKSLVATNRNARNVLTLLS